MQFHVVPDSHEQMSSVLSACKETCASYCYDFHILVFTDNPYHDKNFFNTMFPNLKIAPHATSINNVDANANQFNNNNENLITMKLVLCALE